MTSMRVRLEIFEPKRTRKPTVSPTCSPKVAAMREAAARAASRRGSSSNIFLSLAHASSSSTSGTRVVLPAPGGATRTAALVRVKAPTNRGSASSIGSGVEKVRINYSSFRGGAKRRTRNPDASTAYPSGFRVRSLTLAPRNDKLYFPRPADAFIGKAVPRHFVGAVDVA
jgi:hypothetical protein